MKAKELLIVGAAALAVWAMLKYSGGSTPAATRYWVTEQGNTGYPDAARTGGGVWI